MEYERNERTFKTNNLTTDTTQQCAIIKYLKKKTTTTTIPDATATISQVNDRTSNMMSFNMR